MSTEERIDLIIDATNLTTDELRKASEGLDGLQAAAIKAERSLNDLKVSQSILSSYEALKVEVSELENEVIKSKVAYEDASKSLKKNKNATIEERVAVEKSKIALKEQQKELRALTLERDKQANALKRNGLDLRTSTKNQEILTQKIKEASIQSSKLNATYNKNAIALQKKIAIEKEASLATQRSVEGEKARSEVLRKAADANLHALNAQIKASKEKIKADQLQANEEQRITQGLIKYEKGLISLTTAQREGLITAGKLIKSEEKLRNALNLTTKQITATKKAVEADDRAKREAIEADNRLIVAEKKRVLAAKEAAVASIKLKQEQERVARATFEYSIAIQSLNAQLKKGKISQAEYANATAKVRQQSKLTEAQIKKANHEIVNSGTAFKKGTRNTDLLTQATRRLAQAYTVIIAAQKAAQAVAAGVGAYSQYEVAITKVQKTTDAARREIEAMGDELQRMATDITPTAANELLKYAEIAGQLGVKGSVNLLKMVAVADALNVSTNLAGEEAATLLTRILRMTGEGIPAIDGLASTVVGLGNEFAVAEDEIVNMTKEILTGTSSINLGSSAAAAFGTVLAELGQPAERSRNAIQELADVIANAANKGGDELSRLAEVTGLTGDAIVENLKDKPEVVLEAFVKGLNRLNGESKLTKDVLEQFGITSNRAVAVLGILANNADRVGVAIRKSGEFTAAANEHYKEANKAFANQESALTRVNNLFVKLETAIGKAYTDETAEGIAMATASLKDNEAAVVSVFNALSDFGEILADVVVFINDLGTVIEDTTKTGTLLVNFLLGLRSGIDLTVAAVRGAIIVFNELKIKTLEFTDTLVGLSDANKQLIEDLKKQNKGLAAKIEENLNRIASSGRRIAGESSGAFEDLHNAVAKYKTVLDQLDPAQKAQLETLLATTTITGEADQKAIEFTATLVRLGRIEELNAASRDAQNKRNELSAGELIAANEKEIAVNNALQGVIKESHLDRQRLLELEQQTILAFKEGNLTISEKEIQIIALQKAMKLLNTAEDKAASGESELNRLYSESSEKVRSLSSTLVDLTTKKKELETQDRKLVELDKEKFDIETQIKAINEEIAITIEKRRIQQELENKTIFELLDVQTQHNLKLDELKNQYESGTISISQYDEALKLLNVTTDFLGNALKDHTDNLVATSKAFDSVVESVESSTVALQENNNAVESSSEGLGLVLAEAMNQAISKADQLSKATGNLAREFLGLKKIDISEEFDATAASSEDVAEKIADLHLKLLDLDRAMRSAGNPAIGLSEALLRIEGAGLRAEKAFLLQIAAMKELKDRIDSGELSIKDMDKAVVNLDSKFNLLDGSQLDPLRQSIASARREFASLDSTINSAFSTVEDRLDALLGKEQDIVKRKFKREMDDLLELLKQAETSKDRNLIDKINQAIADLKRAQDIEFTQQFGTKNNNNNNNNNNNTNTNTNPNSTTFNPTPNVTGSGQTVRIELTLPQGNTVGLNVASQSDADALLAALAALGEININGG